MAITTSFPVTPDFYLGAGTVFSVNTPPVRGATMSALFCNPTTEANCFSISLSTIANCVNALLLFVLETRVEVTASV